jgi:hypothetical protein
MLHCDLIDHIDVVEDMVYCRTSYVAATMLFEKFGHAYVNKFKLSILLCIWHCSYHFCFYQSIDSEESQEPAKRRNRLGPAGLALHYANIISQIDALVSSPDTIGCVL